MFDVPWSGGNEIYLATLEEIGLPKRLVKSMKKNGVMLVGDFIQLTEPNILQSEGIGRKSLNEAKNRLSEFGISMSTSLLGWDNDLALEARNAFGRKLLKRIYERSDTKWATYDTIEEELNALLREVEDERNAEMLSQLYGFNESGPKTLESVGQQYSLTRERVRQIGSRVERQLRAIWRPTLQLFSAARLLKFGIRKPFSNNEFISAARSAGLIRTNFHVEGVLRALELVGIENRIFDTQFGDIRLYGSAAENELPKELIHILRRETSANGCTNIQRVALLAGLQIDDAEEVQRILSYFSEVHWLDNERIWLMSVRSTRNRLANVASRVLSVAPTVELNELRAALLRPTRINFVPPVDVLANFLSFSGVAEVRSQKAIAKSSFEQIELGKNDMGIVLAFQELGSPVTRKKLEDYCLDELGMNTSSFYVYLSYSPLVVKLATGIFAFVGDDVSPGSINDMKLEIKAKQFEPSIGWSKVGTLWWHFQADRPTIHSGTHSVPTFVLDYASGKWVFKAVDGLELGWANVQNGFISGLKTAFNVLGVSNKDFVEIDFDIAKRVAFLRIVGDEHEEFTQVFEADEFDRDSADDEAK